MASSLNLPAGYAAGSGRLSSERVGYFWSISNPRYLGLDLGPLLSYHMHITFTRFVNGNFLPLYIRVHHDFDNSLATHTHTHIHIHKYKCTHTSAHNHTRAHARTHTHTYTHTQAHTHTHTHTHTQAHTHTHIHTHSHTHTHTTNNQVSATSISVGAPGSLPAPPSAPSPNPPTPPTATTTGTPSSSAARAPTSAHKNTTLIPGWSRALSSQHLQIECQNVVQPTGEESPSLQRPQRGEGATLPRNDLGVLEMEVMKFVAYCGGVSVKFRVDAVLPTLPPSSTAVGATKPTLTWGLASTRACPALLQIQVRHVRGSVAHTHTHT